MKKITFCLFLFFLNTFPSYTSQVDREELFFFKKGKYILNISPSHTSQVDREEVKKTAQEEEVSFFEKAKNILNIFLSYISQIDGEEVSFFEKGKYILNIIFNGRLSRGKYAFIYLIVSSVIVNNPLFGCLFLLFPIRLHLPYLLLLNARLNDAKLSKWWLLPQTVIAISCQVLILLDCYGRKIVIIKELHLIDLVDFVGIHWEYLVWLYLIIIIALPVVYPLWAPSLSDKDNLTIKKRSKKSSSKT